MMRALVLAIVIVGAAMAYAHWRYADPGRGRGPDAAVIAALMDGQARRSQAMVEGRKMALNREVTKLGCDPLSPDKVECRFRERLVDPQGNPVSSNEPSTARFVFQDGAWIVVDY